MKCPSCNGEGGEWNAILWRGIGGGEWLRCGLCDGAGTVRLSRFLRWQWLGLEDKWHKRIEVKT